MQFQKGNIYHVYNQGNNRQKVFFDRENYLFFLQKIRVHILPHADILAWCLMPNHFHLEIYVNNVEILIEPPKASLQAKPSVPRTLNNSIGIMLRAYTNAVNKRYKRSGSLFRKNTKADCVSCIHGITPSFYMNNGITHININDPQKQYPKILFDYIHSNPVRAGLVKNETDWDFSSSKDYYEKRGGTLINKKRAEEFFDL